MTDIRVVRLHRDEHGFKGVELGMGLLLMGILAAMAIPLMSKVSDRVGEVAAARGTRTLHSANDLSRKPIRAAVGGVA